MRRSSGNPRSRGGGGRPRRTARGRLLWLLYWLAVVAVSLVLLLLLVLFFESRDESSLGTGEAPRRALARGAGGVL